MDKIVLERKIKSAIEDAIWEYEHDYGKMGDISIEASGEVIDGETDVWVSVW